MAELVDWLHHESITRAGTNTANSTIGQPFGNGADVCPVCGKPSTIGKPLTNGDRIRSIGDEELAEWLASIVECDDGCPCIKECGEKEELGFCYQSMLEWLRKESDG